MKQNIRRILKLLTSRGKLITRKEITHFSIFLFFAVIFWFINAMSKEYVTNIVYPVKFSNIPEETILTGKTIDNLTLKVSAHGYILLRNKLSSKYIPINFPLNNITLNRVSKNDKEYYILTDNVKEQLNSQFNPDMEILEVIPDTIFFRFAKLITKKLPVKANINAEPNKQMILKGIPVTDPDSVIVSGPDYILDSLVTINTQFKDFGILSQTTVKQIELQKPKDVKVEDSKVRVKVEIERFTEKTLSVPIEILHLPDTLKIITFPSFIELTCQVGLSNFPKIQTDMFNCVVDFDEASNGTNNLTVNLVKQPEFVSFVKFTPKKVEYLISR